MEAVKCLFQPSFTELFEMANLRQQETGIPGLVYVSTRQGSHGPRVKYFPSGKKSEPGYSVTISDSPRAIPNRQAPRDFVRATSAPVLGFVTQHRDVLLDFWENGSDWSLDDLNTRLRFVDRP